MKTSRVWFFLAMIVGIIAFFVIRHTTSDLGHVAACDGQKAIVVDEPETACEVAARQAYDRHQTTALWEGAGAGIVIVLLCIGGFNERKKEEASDAGLRGVRNGSTATASREDDGDWDEDDEEDAADTAALIWNRLQTTPLVGFEPDSERERMVVTNTLIGLSDKAGVKLQSTTEDEEIYFQLLDKASGEPVVTVGRGTPPRDPRHAQAPRKSAPTPQPPRAVCVDCGGLLPRGRVGPRCWQCEEAHRR
jgi:hypothetical protein